MKRPTLALATLAFLLMMSHAVSAQEPPEGCKVYFAMFLYDLDLEISAAPAMDTDQSRWLKGKGGKKYPGFCWDYEKATYVMVTIRWSEKSKREVTKTRRAYTTGPVTEVVGTAASGPGRPSQPIWGTQLRTFVTTWQETEMESVDEPRALVVTFETADGKPLSETTELKPHPACKTKGAGKNAAKDAFEFTLDHLTRVYRARHNQSRP